MVLWAWDRYEDLRFLKPGEAEVAGLLVTIQMKNGKGNPWFRHLPLLVPEGVPLYGVARLESDGSGLPGVVDVALWIRLLRGGKLPVLQVDFDARESERDWYARLLKDLRRTHKVSITALASWCLDKPWFEAGGEAVPMLFRMGPDRGRILARLRRQGGFANECAGAVGLATDEPLAWRPDASRVYLFHPTRWTREAFDAACARLF